jgi:hypothetical protein
VKDQVLHPYKTKLYFFVSRSVYFWMANWKAKNSAPNDSKHSLDFSLLLITSWMKFLLVKGIPG